MKRQLGKRKTENHDLIPGMLLFAVFPVIVKCQLVRVYLCEYPWFPDGEQQYDFFMYWKSVVFLVLTVCMLAVLTDRVLLRKRKAVSWKSFLPVFLYGGLAILSTVLSVNRTLSLKGMWEQYESIWVLLGYVITAYYFFQVVETREDVKRLLTALTVGAALQGVLGLMQVFGVDFWSTTLGTYLITLGNDSSLRDSLNFAFAGSASNSVYMASYNPNYAGVYAVLVIPPVLAWTVLQEKRWKQAAEAVLTGVLLICLVKSGSRTGILVLACIGILAAWMIPQRKKRKVLFTGGILVCAAAGLLAYDAFGGHSLGRALKKSVQKVESYRLSAVEPSEDAVNICYCGRRIALSAEHTAEGDTLKAVENGTERLPVYWDVEEQCFYIDDPDFSDIRFDAFVEDGCSYVVMIRNKITWYFVKDSEAEGYTYLTQYGKSDQIVTAASVLNGYEKALTNRGYIWGRVLPLLPSYLLWGSGPDTFVVAFPQNDYLMRANTGTKTSTEILSKAHNMYLQTALQTGMLSLLCLLLFWGRYVVRSFRMYSGKRIGREQAAAIGIFLGIAGYLLTGMLNDSVVAVAPVFWGLLGMGMAVNRKI